jgi:hypothetical protein
MWRTAESFILYSASWAFVAFVAGDFTCCFKQLWISALDLEFL